jgi:hypothetical protein
MTLIRSVHALVYTGDESDAGTDGDVYLGAGGREFHLDTEGEDFDPGSMQTYRFGTFPTVFNAATNDPQDQRLVLETIELMPLYIRFETRNREDRWRLKRAIVVFNSQLSPMFDSELIAPNGIWLDARSGLVLHLPRVPEEPLRDARTFAEFEALLFADEPSRVRRSDEDRPEREMRVVEALEGEVPRLRDADEPTDSLEPISPQEVVESIRSTKGSSTVLTVWPELQHPDAWSQIGFISLCGRSGTIRTLEIRDTNADILGDGSIFVWGKNEFLPQSRVRCRFDVPSGRYTFTVRLRAWDPMNGARVECLINTTPLGSVWLNTTFQNYTFTASLGAGSHSLSVRQEWGQFRFLSLSIWSIPVVSPA